MMDDEVEDYQEDSNVCLCPYPLIYEGQEEDPPEGFNAVMIALDGRLQANLDWKEARDRALSYIRRGYAIMWNLELGLFTHLLHPLTHQGQFLTLSLSLEHFRDGLWKEFKAHTIGVAVYHGSADFSQGFPWSDEQEKNVREWLKEVCDKDFLSVQDILSQEEEGEQLIRLFCRNVCMEYLTLLTARFPDSLSMYLYLDASSIAFSSVHAIQILNPECFTRLRSAQKGHHLSLGALGWGDPTSLGYCGSQYKELSNEDPIVIGICIPPLQYHRAIHYAGLDEAIFALQKHKIAYKVIAEVQLTSQWDGLDYIIYSPSGLTLQGKRKLQGFCAAGGTVVSLGNLLDFPNELRLNDWLQQISESSC